MTGCQGARVLVLPGLVGRHNATRLIPMLPTAFVVMLESFWNPIALESSCNNIGIVVVAL